MRVATDIHGLERAAPADWTMLSFSAAMVPSRCRRNLRLLRAAARSDYLVIHFSLPEVMLFASALAMLPFSGHCHGQPGETAEYRQPMDPTPGA